LAIEVRPINGSVLAFRTTAPTASVTLLALDLTTGEVVSDYFNEEQLRDLSETAKSVLAVIEPEDRASASQGFVSRLLPISSLDAGTVSLDVNGGDGTVALAQVAVAGTRYFAVQFPHSIIGSMGFGSGDGGGQGGQGTDVIITPSSPTLVGTSPDMLVPGMLVARNRSGTGFVRADASNVQRMPALGLVTKVADGGTGPIYTIQTSGPISNIFTATGDFTLFTGLDGYPTGNVAPLTYVQPIGNWLATSTLNFNPAPSVTIKSPS
jgi:hypothetical protein